MADPAVGATTILDVDVAPYDNTSAAVLTLYLPDGTSVIPDIGAGVELVNGDNVAVMRFSTLSPYRYTLAGWYVAHWEFTGLVEDGQDGRFFVAATPVAADGPLWVPSLERVAAYVPRRTLIEAADGYGIVRRTFDDTTHPDAAAVTLLIVDAVSWVTDRCGALDITLYDSGQGLAARRAAAFVELGYPDNDADIAIAKVLLAELERELKALAGRNEALTGEDPDDPGRVFEVAYNFPPADCRYDVPGFI